MIISAISQWISGPHHREWFQWFHYLMERKFHTFHSRCCRWQLCLHTTLCDHLLQITSSPFFPMAPGLWLGTKSMTVLSTSVAFFFMSLSNSRSALVFGGVFLFLDQVDCEFEGWSSPVVDVVLPTSECTFELELAFVFFDKDGRKFDVRSGGPNCEALSWGHCLLPLICFLWASANLACSLLEWYERLIFSSAAMCLKHATLSSL